MPSYDLRCKKCGVKHELKCKIVELDGVLANLKCLAAHGATFDCNDGSRVPIPCDGQFEVVIEGDVPWTKHALGFSAGLVTSDGKLHHRSKVRPKSIPGTVKLK